MKIRILLLSFFLLFLCGCASSEPPLPLVEFSAEGIVCIDDKLQSRSEYQVKVASAARGVLSVTITNPPELSGLCCRWGDGFEMEYSEITLKRDEDFLPEFSFQRVIHRVLMDLSEKGECTGFEDGVATFQGVVPAGEYVVKTDREGYIQNISVKEINLEIQFSHKE